MRSETWSSFFKFYRLATRICRMPTFETWLGDDTNLSHRSFSPGEGWFLNYFFYSTWIIVCQENIIYTKNRKCLQQGSHYGLHFNFLIMAGNFSNLRCRQTSNPRRDSWNSPIWVLHFKTWSWWPDGIHIHAGFPKTPWKKAPLKSRNYPLHTYNLFPSDEMHISTIRSARRFSPLNYQNKTTFHQKPYVFPPGKRFCPLWKKPAGVYAQYYTRVTSVTGA